VDARGAHACDRLAGARTEQRVLCDQGAVEVAREGGDACGESGRELYGGVPPVALTTNAATFAISCVLSCPWNDGIAPLPRVTRAVAFR